MRYRYPASEVNNLLRRGRRLTNNPLSNWLSRLRNKVPESRTSGSGGAIRSQPREHDAHYQVAMEAARRVRSVGWVSCSISALRFHRILPIRSIGSRLLFFQSPGPAQQRLPRRPWPQALYLSKVQEWLSLWAPFGCCWRIGT